MKANRIRGDEEGEDDSPQIAPSEGGDSKNLSWSESFQTRGSDARLKILQELLKEDRDISGLAGSVGLCQATIRYHINILLRENLVEKYSHRGEGEVGRPATRIRLRSAGMIRSFPPRQYQLLSEILLGVIEGALDSEERKKVLYDAGWVAGERLIESMGQDSVVSAWTPERFVQHYLAGALATMGLITAVADVGPSFVRYRSFPCPFQELALKHPDRICDHLDRGYHEGLAAALGTGVVHERLACMGHGDPFCEDRMRWPDVSKERE